MRREGDAQCSVKLKRGRLDVEVEERQEKVQKEGQRVAEWSEAWMKSKIGMYACKNGLYDA